MGRLSALEDLLRRRPCIVWAGLLLAYVAKFLGDATYVDQYYRIIFECFSLYVAKYILFAQGAINPALGSVPVVPANAFFIYPPGTYLSAYLLGSVRNTLLFSFLMQACVPVFAYQLFSRALRPLLAFLLALAVVHYSVRILLNPDFVIQGLLLGIVLLLSQEGAEPGKAARWPALLGAALLSGIVMIFKHNIGIFALYGALCFLFFRHLDENDSRPGLWSRPLFLAGAVVNILVALFLVRRMPHWDERLYYSLPPLLCWMAVLLRFGRERAFGFRGLEFLREAIAFGAAALVLPFSLFLLMGRVVGFHRYFYSLFQMGFDYIKTWDNGVWEVSRSYVNFPAALAPGTLGQAYNALVIALLFALPLFLGVLAGGNVLFDAFRKRPFGEFFRKASWLALGAAFCFGIFPLEDIRNLQTKIILPLFVLLFVLKPSAPAWWRKGVGVFLLLVLFAGTLPSYRKSLQPHAGAVLPAVERLNVKMEGSLAKELERATGTIAQATGGKRFFLVDLSSQELVPLLWAQAQDWAPQYFLEIRESMLNHEVLEVMEQELASLDYVVVRRLDLDDYLGGRISAEQHKRLLGRLARDFRKVAQYDLPEESARFSGLSSFYVLKRL